MSTDTVDNSNAVRLPFTADVKLHPLASAVSYLKSGLIVFAGATGAGKSASQAALIRKMHNDRELKITTVEDPIEFYYGAGKSTITHYEVGTQVSSFYDGAKTALLGNPDVLQIGELRDPATIGLAIEQASHRLIITSMHGNSTEGIYERIIDTFPPKHANSLKKSLSALTVLIVHQEWNRNEEGKRILNVEAQLFGRDV